MRTTSPDTGGTFVDVLRRLDHRVNGVAFGSAPAEVLPYVALGALIRGNARHFASAGVRRGDRVAIAIATDLEHIVALFALIAIGAIPVSVKLARVAGDAHYADALRHIAARYRIAFSYRSLPELGVPTVAWDPTATATGDEIFAEVAPDDLCLVQFSSGSLGDPKPVPLRHASLVANLRAILAIDQRTEATQGWTFLPLSHDMGLIGGLLSNLVAQNSIYLTTPQSFLRRPIELFTQHRTAGDSVVPMPDFALRYLARHLAARAGKPDPRLLSGLRTVYCGAEPIRRDTVAAALETMVAWGFDPRALVFCYGMAEATLLVTAGRFRSLAESFATAAHGHSIASVGRPAPDTELKVIDEVIHVRGPGVCRGYLDAAPFADGWHDTGDGGFERDGELFITGRVKEMLIINGENLFPHDIEQLVLREPGIRDCMVMSEQDRFFVAVVPAPNATPALAELAARIGVQCGAVPTGMTFATTSELLRTTSGKPQRDATLAALHPRITSAY